MSQTLGFGFSSREDGVDARRRGVMVWLVLVTLGSGLEAQERGLPQDEALQSYYRAVAEYFRVPASEVAILSDWRLPPDEIPVVLFVARRAGVSAEALVALRRSGRSWWDIASRYRVGAGAFYVPLPDDADAGPLASVYSAFRGRPSDGWSELRLADADMVGLVNVRVLSETLDVPPERILAAAGAGRSFVAVYRTLIR